MNWREKIEAQIAFMESMYGPGISGSMKDAALESGERVIRALLDVAVAANAAAPLIGNEYVAKQMLDSAFDKLREVE